MRHTILLLAIAVCVAVADNPPTLAETAQPFGLGSGTWRPAQAGEPAVTLRSGPGTGEKLSGRFWDPPVFISDEALWDLDADCDDVTGVMWLVLAPSADSLIRFYNSTDHGASWTYVQHADLTPRSTYWNVKVVVGTGDSNYVHAFVRHDAAMGDLYDIRLKQDLSYMDFYPVQVGPDTLSSFDVCRDNRTDYGLFALTSNPYSSGENAAFLRSFDFGKTWDRQPGTNIRRPTLCAGADTYLHIACTSDWDRNVAYFYNSNRGDPSSWGARTSLGTDTFQIYDAIVSAAMTTPESLATVWVLYSHSNNNTADFDADYAVRSDSWGGTWLKHQQLAATSVTELVRDAECYREPGNKYTDAALVVSDTAEQDSVVVQYTWANGDAPRSWLAPIKVSDTLKAVRWPEPKVVFSPGATPYNVPGIVFSRYNHYGAWFNAAWFGSGAAEPGQSAGHASAPGATIVRGVLRLPPAPSVGRPATADLLDISGRRVMSLRPGLNDVRQLARGVYYVVRAAAQPATKVVLE